MTGAGPYEPTIEVAYREAAHRYLHDATFHARVERGVIAAGQAGLDLTKDSERGRAVHVAAMTLHLSDVETGAYLPTPADGDGA